MVEENFRRALLLSRGDLSIFVTRPISAAFIAVCTLLVLVQVGFWLRGRLREWKAAASQPSVQEDNPFPAGTVEDA
jgi:TctA family transporter